MPELYSNFTLNREEQANYFLFPVQVVLITVAITAKVHLSKLIFQRRVSIVGIKLPHQSKVPSGSQQQIWKGILRKMRKLNPIFTLNREELANYCLYPVQNRTNHLQQLPPAKFHRGKLIFLGDNNLLESREFSPSNNLRVTKGIWRLINLIKF